MSKVTIDQFDDFFRELHGYKPYSWQQRLAEKVVNGDWPKAIDLPTGSGKTACIDVAIFAMACQEPLPPEQRTAPRRVFFCVNRRVIVDEAHLRSQGIARKLWKAERETTGNSPVLKDVAKALRIMAGTTGDHDIPPLDVLELRGGIYRDNRWARSVTQPAVVCTTIDQLGSRLLFRGYGVSPNAAPIQAALIAYDSLILLDEAHISRPFLQTLQQARQYLEPQKWVEQDIGIKPVEVVPMTATPPEDTDDCDVIRLGDKDRENESLLGRLNASKPAMLSHVTRVAKAAVLEAVKLAVATPTVVGIIVNRVATAKEVYKNLREDTRIAKTHPNVVIELVIGSMRPIDRDRQASRLRALVGPDRPHVSKQTSFIVATQCLEVGADYDFDALVTECASLDALRQRFGRLNRGGRDIQAKAVVLVGKKDIKPENKLDDAKPHDPIYGNAAARTWNWLDQYATRDQGDEDTLETATKQQKSQKKTGAAEMRSVDFGIDALDSLLAEHGENGCIPAKLMAPSASLNAPIILPAYVDFWCQTSPRPVPDPDISLFLHGPQRGEPDVQVCWRADLVDGDRMSPDEHWCDVVALLSPTSAECMSVPISRLRRWLTDTNAPDDHGDLLGVAEDPDNGDGKKRMDRGRKPLRKLDGVLWRGTSDSTLIKSPDDLRPGDTLVLPVTAGGWDVLGHLPSTCVEDEQQESPAKDQRSLFSVDAAEVAFQESRDRAALRLHPSLRERFPEGDVFDPGLFTRHIS